MSQAYQLYTERERAKSKPLEAKEKLEKKNFKKK